MFTDMVGYGVPAQRRQDAGFIRSQRESETGSDLETAEVKNDEARLKGMS